MRCYKIHWFLNRQLYYLFLCWYLVYGELRYSVPEGLQLGAFVGNIADDLGLDVNQLSAHSFRILTGPWKQYLDVNVDNGILFLKEQIDREQLCGSALSCILSLEAVTENPFNLYRIKVEILDVNDNGPIFPKSQFRLEISEVAAPGARFPLECAHDPDVGSNSLQTYQLAANEYFTLNIETTSVVGKLPVLVLDKALDREKQSTLNLMLIAKDGGVPTRSGTAQIMVLVVDANDNSPVFSQASYRRSLLENVPKGTLILKLNATDMDDGSNGEIVYSFSSHNSAIVRELFDLDSRTGEIRVKGKVDYEESKVFELNIKALDRGPNATPGYCRVLIDIVDMNDNAPEMILTSLISSVPEDAPPGTMVALISTTDKDSGENGQIRCQIENNIPFKLDSSLQDYYRLLTQALLDRESIGKYEFTVMCSDNGKPSLVSNKTIRVEVIDINDNAPRFMEPLYTAYVSENNAIGISIFSMTAVDPDINQNGRLSYCVLDSEVQGASVFNYVRINSKSGVIYSQRSFDYEQLKNFQVHIQAQDSGLVPLASNVSLDIIVLDQNDNAPIILHPLSEFGSTATETVSRHAGPGYLVAKVSAIDSDSGQNSRLNYQILQAANSELFTISPDTGEIWTTRGIVGKDVNKQKLVIVVKDSGTPPLSATMTMVLSLVDGDTEILADRSGISEEPGLTYDMSLYLVISLGIISSMFLLILITLAVKIHKNRNGFDERNCSLGVCCCSQTKTSLNGIQKASRNLQIPPNYVEVFGGDPLSQSFRYETCSVSDVEMFYNRRSPSTMQNIVRSETIGKENNPGISNSANYSEVRSF